MAMTPKIITTSTPLAAATMLALLGATVWLVAEYAPGANLVQPDELVVEAAPPPSPSTAPRAQLDVPFSPDERPADPTACANTSDQIFEVFEPLARGEDVELRTRVLAALIGEYIADRCPHAIHEGDWHATAQILGVGIIYQALEPQSAIYHSSVVWDPRAEHLVDVSVGTFDVLSPEAMCNEALRQPEVGGNSLTPLVDDCIAAF